MDSIDVYTYWMNAGCPRLADVDQELRLPDGAASRAALKYFSASKKEMEQWLAEALADFAQALKNDDLKLAAASVERYRVFYQNIKRKEDAHIRGRRQHA